MASIDPQIDAAVVAMKARAAEFDKTKTMDGMGFFTVMDMAAINLAHAATHYLDRYHEVAMIDLVDTMNLCALALSLLSEEQGDD